MSRPTITEPIGHVMASAAIVDLTKPLEVRRQKAARREWQTQAWPLYRSLPEVRYPANYIGNGLSRFTMRPGLVDPSSPTADPRVPDPAKRPDVIKAAEEILEGLQGPQGGISEIQRRYGLNMNISADGWMLGIDGDDETSWEFVSVNELQFQNWMGEERVFRNALGSGDCAVEENLLPTTGIYTQRFWYSHPEFSMQADGPLESLAADCQRLLDLNDSIGSRLLSRLASAGILYLPNSISMPITPQPEGSDLAEMDPVIATVISYMTQSIQNRGTAAGALPIIMRGPDDLGEKIKHITLDRIIDESEMRLREELRTTITRGQDLPVEVQTGMGASNHWSSWAIGDDTVSSHMQPGADRFADGLTRVFLRPALRDLQRFDPEEVRSVVILADGSNVVTRPNASEDYRQLHDRITVSDRALRNATGAEESDVPDEEEYLRILGRQVHNPYLATIGMKVHETVDWDKVAAVGSSEGAPGVGGKPSSRLPADSSNPVGGPGTGVAGNPDRAARRAGNSTPR